MKRLLILLAFVAAPLYADEPHIEFVERMRTHGLADIALDYVDELAKRPPPNVGQQLPLERARTLVALAEQLHDSAQRDQRLTQARHAFSEFLKTGLDQRTANVCRLELARLIVRQGRHRVASAKRNNNISERQDALAKARPIFDQAAQELRTVRTVIEAESANEVDFSTARMMLEVRFEFAMLTMNRAFTFSDRMAEQRGQRAQELEAARKQFMELSELNSHEPICWRAFAEAGRCSLELDNGAEALRVFSAIAKASHAPVDVVRTGRYYELQLNDRMSRTGSTDVARGCENWLSRYPDAVNTPEGQGVQFLLASNLIQQAQSGITPARNNDPVGVSSSARSILEKAERTLKRLASVDGEYSHRAANLRAEVLVTLMSARAAAGVDRLNNFEECYLFAQMEAYQLSRKNNGQEAAKQRHLNRAIQALRRGLTLVTRLDDASEVFAARIMLSYLFLVGNDPYSCAVLGEHLARTNAPAPRGAKAAAYALSAFAMILSDSRNRQCPPDDIADDVRRLRTFAEFVERTWPNESDTDAARLQLGNLFLDDRQLVDAADMLARIGDGFAALPFARFRQGVAAQLAQKPSVDIPAATKKRMLSQAIAALDKIPDLPQGSSNATIIATYQARLQLGQLLLLDGESAANFDRIEAIGTQLKSRLAGLMETSDPAYPQLEAECERTRLSGLWGKAWLAVGTGQYQQARKLLEPQLRVIATATAGWKSSPHVSESWFQSMINAQRDVLLLDARASILSGQSASLRAAVDAVKNLSNDDNQQATYDLLLKLVYDLKKDLDGLKSAGDAARRQRLQDGLVGLLDELSRPTELTPDVRVYLAQGYSAIDRHDKAAELLTKIAAPQSNDETVIKTYRFARLSVAREYRLAKEYAQAKGVLREILGTQQQKGWGFENFDVRKEAIALLADEGSFAAAVQMAVQMQNQLLGSVHEHNDRMAKVRELRQDGGKNPEAAAQAKTLEQEAQQSATLRERYYEFYFQEIQAIVESAKKGSDVKSAETHRRIAARLTKLEKSQPDAGGDASRVRITELVAGNNSLRDAYIAAGGQLFLTKATSGAGP